MKSIDLLVGQDGTNCCKLARTLVRTDGGSPVLLLLLFLLRVAVLVVVDMDYTGRKFEVIHMVQPATWDSKK